MQKRLTILAMVVSLVSVSCFQNAAAATLENEEEYRQAIRRREKQISELRREVTQLKEQLKEKNREIKKLKDLCRESGIDILQEESKTMPKKEVEAVEYEIVGSEDQSRKAMTKPLSTYRYQELVKLPIDKRMEYRVVVSSTIKKNQVRPTAEKVISDITSKDNDIDEITLFLYSDEELANGWYDVAKATWAPYGKLGNVTPEIAKTNKRNNYKLEIKIKENLEEYLEQRAKSEDVVGLTEAERRRIFKEIVAAEDRAWAEADKKYPVSGRSVWGLSQSELRSRMDKNTDLAKNLEERYKKELAKEFDLTREQLKQISNEGVSERWPLE